MNIGIVFLAPILGLPLLAAAQAPKAIKAPVPRKAAVVPSKAATKPGLEPLVQRAEKGDLAACEKLAAAYEQGVGAPKDFLKAATYYQKACQGGSAPSCLKLVEIKLANPDLSLSHATKEESGPDRIDFSTATPRFAPGYRWTYRLTSGDESLNEKSLEMTFLERVGAKLAFRVDLAGAANRFEIDAAPNVKYFQPKSPVNASFMFEALTSYPEAVEKGHVWSIQTGRKGIIRGGQLVGWEPSPLSTAVSGDFRLSPEGKVPTCRLRTSFDGLLQYELDLSPSFALPLNFLTKTTSGKWVWGELAAVSGPELKSTPEYMAPESRHKLVSWLKANLDPTSITFPVCMSLMVGGAQQDPQRTIMVVGGKGLTISGRAFFLLKTPAAFTIGEFSDEEVVRYGIQANVVKSLPVQ